MSLYTAFRSVYIIPEQIDGGVRRPFFVVEHVVLVQPVEGVSRVKARHQHLVHENLMAAKENHRSKEGGGG